MFNYTLERWITDEKVGFEFIIVLGHLYYDKSIELIIFRSQLIDRTSSVILYKHAYSQNTVGTPLKIQDSLLLARTMLEMNLAPARIDIGKLNFEWTVEKSKFKGPKEFLADKLSHIVGKKVPFEKPVDVVVYGFGAKGPM